MTKTSKKCLQTARNVQQSSEDRGPKTRLTEVNNLEPLRQKVIDLVEKSPEKAAIILTSWIHPKSAPVQKKRQGQNP